MLRCTLPVWFWMLHLEEAEKVQTRHFSSLILKWTCLTCILTFHLVLPIKLHILHLWSLICSCTVLTCFFRVPSYDALKGHFSQTYGLIFLWTAMKCDCKCCFLLALYGHNSQLKPFVLCTSFLWFFKYINVENISPHTVQKCFWLLWI